MEGVRERFAAVLGALSDGVIATDAQERITEANPAAHRLLGSTELVGTRLVDVLPPGRAEVVERRADRLVRRWRVAGEDGAAIVEVVSTPTPDGGGSGGAVHAVRDVTQQAQLVRLKEEFLLDVAHELRTPIAALSASLDLMLQDAADMPREQLASMLSGLHRGTLRLEALVENLLDVGSIQAGTFAVRAIPTSLRRCVQDAASVARPLLSAKRQEVSVRIARGCDRVVADPRRTSQVIANLLTNAHKHAPEGTRISLTAGPEEGFVVVSVRDRGPGIPEEEWERVFERFYRSRRDRGETTGIGVGLAICRAIVAAQGGTIQCRNAPEGGAIVRFSVPRASQAPARQGIPA